MLYQNYINFYARQTSCKRSKFLSDNVGNSVWHRRTIWPEEVIHMYVPVHVCALASNSNWICFHNWYLNVALFKKQLEFLWNKPKLFQSQQVNSLTFAVIQNLDHRHWVSTPSLPSRTTLTTQLLKLALQETIFCSFVCLSQLWLFSEKRSTAPSMLVASKSENRSCRAVDGMCSPHGRWLSLWRRSVCDTFFLMDTN